MHSDFLARTALCTFRVTGGDPVRVLEVLTRRGRDVCSVGIREKLYALPALGKYTQDASVAVLGLRGTTQGVSNCEREGLGLNARAVKYE